MANILITIDVEDWFQVENFKPWISFSSWPRHELRVEKNTHRLLDLFDSISTEISSTYNSKHTTRNSIKVTFFVLGWIAERLPNLVREIQFRGHEVASHGYNHKLCNQHSYEDLKKDLTDSKKLLEDITGTSVVGYRAPNFSISDDTLKIIQECGYLYDSSYNSFAMHGRYGKLNLTLNGTRSIAIKVSRSQQLAFPLAAGSTLSYDQMHNFYELPISNFNVGKYVFPWGGGGYFRMIPLPLFAAGVNTILGKTNGYVFYVHPWEVDPDQPKVNDASAFYKFRHYINLKSTQQKLSKFIKKLHQHHFITCSQYINEIEN